MEVGGGVEPEVELNLPVARSLGEDIGVDGVGLTAEVAKELKVNLIVVASLRGEVVAVPAEFPGTSLICMSNFLKRYVFFDWKPEEELLSRVNWMTSPSLRTLAFPQGTSKYLCMMSAHAANNTLHKMRRGRNAR